jgi:hypothetical protein
MCRVSWRVACRAVHVFVKVCGYLSHSDCKDKADVNCVIPFLPQTANKVLPPPLVRGTHLPLIHCKLRLFCARAMCAMCDVCVCVFMCVWLI